MRRRDTADKTTFHVQLWEAQRRAGYTNDKDFAGHSFRDGEATTGASLGVEDSLMKGPRQMGECSISALYTDPIGTAVLSLQSAISFWSNIRTMKESCWFYISLHFVVYLVLILRVICVTVLSYKGYGTHVDVAIGKAVHNWRRCGSPDGITQMITIAIP